MSGQGGAGGADQGAVAVAGGDFDDSNAITGFRVTDTKVGISETMEFCWVVKNFEALAKGDLTYRFKSPTFEGPLSKEKWFLSFNRPKDADGKIMCISLHLKETPALCVEVKFGSMLILSPEDEDKDYECVHLLKDGFSTVTLAEDSLWCWIFRWPVGFPDDTFKLKFQLTVNFVEPKGPVGIVFTPDAAAKFQAKLQARNNAIKAAKKNQK